MIFIFKVSKSFKERLIFHSPVSDRFQRKKSEYQQTCYDACDCSAGGKNTCKHEVLCMNCLSQLQLQIQTNKAPFDILNRYIFSLLCHFFPLFERYLVFSFINFKTNVFYCMSESQCGKANNLNTLSYKYFKAFCSHLRELISQTEITFLWCIIFVTEEMARGKRKDKKKK